MINVEPTIITTEVQTKVIETEVTPTVIQTEITPNNIDLYIAPSQSVTYNVNNTGSNQERLLATPINISQFSIVSHTSEGLILADCFNIESWNIAGISLESTPNGGSILVQYSGVVSNFFWNWVMSKPIFVGRNGQMTQHPPDEAVFLSQIATPMTPDSILIDIKEVIFL